MLSINFYKNNDSMRSNSRKFFDGQIPISKSTTNNYNLHVKAIKCSTWFPSTAIIGINQRNILLKHSKAFI